MLVKFSFRLLNLSQTVSFSLLLNFSFKFLLLNCDHLGTNFSLLFLLCNFSFSCLNVDGLQLFLFLNLISCVSFSLLRIGDTLKVSLLHFEIVLLLSDFEICRNLCVVCGLCSFSLCNLHVTFSICTGNRRCLLNSHCLIDTEVFNNLTVIREVLDVKGLNDNTELFKVRDSIFKNLFRNLLSVSDHIDKVHLADNFTHIAFQNVHNHFLNLFNRLIEEVLCSFLNCFRFVRNLRINNSIDGHIDIVLRRNRITCLDVNRNQLQAKNISTFEERNLETGMSDNCSKLSETRNDNDFIRRRLDIRRDEENEEEKYEYADARTDEDI